MPSVTRNRTGVLLLVLLLAGFLSLAALPNGVAAIRVAGVSMLWWYGGLLAPVLGWIVAVGLLSPSAPAARAPDESDPRSAR